MRNAMQLPLPRQELPTVLLTGIIAGMLLAVAGTIQSAVEVSHAGGAVPWIGLWRAQVTGWVTYGILMVPVWHLARRWTLARGAVVDSLAMACVVSVPIALLKEIVCVAIGDYFRPGVFYLGDLLAGDFLAEMMTVWALFAIAWLAQRLLGAPVSFSQAETLVIKDGTSTRIVRVADIKLAETQGNYVLVATARGRLLLRMTMREFSAQLGGQFIRVHRRHIVRNELVDAITTTDGSCRLHLRDGTMLPVGRAYRAAVLTLLHDELRGAALSSASR